MSIKPPVFIDSNENKPELIMRSLPDVTTGENGIQNQSMNHIFRYSEELVNTMTQRLEIARILPTGQSVLLFTLSPIQQEITENTIKRGGSMRNVILNSANLEDHCKHEKESDNNGCNRAVHACSFFNFSFVAFA
jgi:hypothetical protein